MMRAGGVGVQVGGKKEKYTYRDVVDVNVR